MRLSILAIGKMKAGPERELVERYVDRTNKAGRGLGVQSLTIKEWPESREVRAENRKDEEARRLVDACKNTVLIALDEHGRDMSSEGFSQLIKAGLENATAEIAIAIGGADGHGSKLLNRADHVVRFGKMTWPHQIVRILAAEQIYRAITILSGHPYHRQ